MKKLLLCLLTACILCGTCAAAVSEDLTCDMAVLTAQSRAAGSEGEAAVRQWAADTLTDLGYTVTTQAFDGSIQNVGTDYTAQNLIATRLANENADSTPILVVSAHLDSIGTTVGANDNASGCAAVLALARAAAQLPSAIELRFVLFSGEEDGLLGSTAYAKSLTEAEKSRMLGDLQIDMIGNRYQTGWLAATANGEENALTELLRNAASDMGVTIPAAVHDAASDHTPFQLVGIPSVLFTQDGDGYENHTMADDLTIIDEKWLEQGVSIARQALLTAMQGGMLPRAASAVGCMTRQDVFEPYMTVDSLERVFGVPLTLISEEQGDLTLTDYTAPVRWFGLETPFETHFQLMEHQLGAASFHPDGFTAEEFKAFLTELFGAPVSDTAESTDWNDSVYHKSYSLQYEPLTLNVSFYKDKAEQVTYYLDYYGRLCSPALDPRMERLWTDVISKVIPENYRTLISAITLYSDGYHEEMGRTVPESEDSNSRMRLLFDVEDVFDENGEYRHFIKTVNTVVHEFFHALCENSTQVTLGEEGGIRGFYDVCRYADDSYEAQFYRAFYPEEYVLHYSLLYTPDAYVSIYASTGLGEDLSESFTHFVFLPKQEGATIAQQKVNFFYQFDELVALRTSIRDAFQLN